MIKNTESSHVLEALGWGVARATVVNTLTYPLEVIKTNLQVDRSTKTAGVAGLFKGFAPNFAKVIIRQSVWWPAVAYVPDKLSAYPLSSTQRSVILGVSVAAMETLVNSPLERWRILSSTGTDNQITIRSFLKDGWSGFFPYLWRQSMTWSLFFIGQHQFNKPYKKGHEQMQLTHIQVLTTATKLSLVANVIINPFDTINSIKQSGGQLNFMENPLKKLGVLYRGFPLNFAIMLIQTTATVWLMDVIETKRYSK